MDTSIVRYEDRDGQHIELTPADVASFCATGSGQLSERDVVNFMATCKALGANPFTKDVYLVKYGSDGDAQIIAGKNYYTRVAASMDSFDGMKAGIVVVTNQGELAHREGSIILQGEMLAGGWAEVHDKRWTVPVRAEVAFAEYNTGKSLWRSKPATMIRKVALVQALREAYPDRFAGTYDASEMPEPPKSQAVQAKVEKPKPPAEDMAYLKSATDELVALGFKADEVKPYLWREYQQGGRDGAESAVAAMRAAAGATDTSDEDEELLPDEVEF